MAPPSGCHGCARAALIFATVLLLARHHHLAAVAQQAGVAGLCFKITTYHSDGSVRSRDVLQPLNAFTPAHPLVKDYSSTTKCHQVLNDGTDWAGTRCTPVCGANFSAYSPLPRSFPFCSSWQPDFSSGGSGRFMPNPNEECYAAGGVPGETCNASQGAAVGEYFYA